MFLNLQWHHALPSFAQILLHEGKSEIEDLQVSAVEIRVGDNEKQKQDQLLLERR